MNNNRKFKDYLIESLKNSKEAKAYLQVALEEYESDENTKRFLKMLRNVAEAQGGVLQLAKKTKLNRQNLYRVLSEKGNPRISTLSNILKGLGFSLTIKEIKSI